MYKKLLGVILSIILVCCMTGCDEIKADSPAGETYATQNKVSALEYNIYMNKQIQIFINQISSRMGIARNISEGSQVDNEYSLALESAKVMQETYDETATVYPSNGSDDERESTLLAMSTAIAHMEAYAEDVNKGNSVDGYVKDFENDFNQLTSLANFYNQ